MMPCSMHFLSLPLMTSLEVLRNHQSSKRLYYYPLQKRSDPFLHYTSTEVKMKACIVRG